MNYRNVRVGTRSKELDRRQHNDRTYLLLRTRSEGRERRPCTVDDWWRFKAICVGTDALDFAGEENGESAKYALSFH